jgi:hypothetical protein
MMLCQALSQTAVFPAVAVKGDPVQKMSFPLVLTSMTTQPSKENRFSAAPGFPFLFIQKLIEPLPS